MELNIVLLTEACLILILGFLYLLMVYKKPSYNTWNYSNTEWNFYLKKLWSIYHINKWKKSNKNEVKIDNQTEKPISIDERDLFDSQYFWGSNSEGCSIYIVLCRKYEHVSEVALILTMANGTVYKMPNQPDTMIFNASSKTWQAGNLKIVMLESFKRWRIIFNGMMRKENTDKTITDSEVIHVKMNFIWNTVTKPMRIIDDCDVNMLAESVALEPWKNPNWLNGIKNYPVHGYDQYGSLSGLIVINNSESPIEMFLSGIRERRWGLNYSNFMHHALNLTGKTSDGTFYNISVQSLKYSLNRLVFGNVRLPNYKSYPIEWTDIDSSQIGENELFIRRAFTIRFKAASKLFTVVIHLDKSKINLLRGGRPWDWEKSIIPFQGSINDFQGVGILQLSYNYTGDCPLPIPITNDSKQLQFIDMKDVNKDNICLPLTNEDARCSQFVGAKTASLALLLSADSKNYKVPNGFCLTIHALNLQLEYNLSLLNAIIDVENNNSSENKDILKESCDRAYKLFVETDLCESVKEAVSKNFEELLNSEKNTINDLYFAVRSSGIGEDSEDLSAAGQNATILGCKTIEDIYKAIRKCWASLFAYQSVEYRRQHGQNVNCGMGVVVQTIVEAESAGVMFTRHPMTGDPSCILITSNYGLGESVVSGEIEPDSIYIERNLNDEIKIKKIEIGSKSHKMSLDKSNINVDSRLQKSEINIESKTISISEENCLKLGNIAISQEALWGSPRDIEWAVVNDTVYLVQARPITTLQTWTEFELLHELDSPIMSDDDLITFANTGEVLPGCETPLSLSTLTSIMDNSVSMLFGEEFDEYYLKNLFSTHYHMALNAIKIMFFVVPKEIDLMNKVNDISLFGHVVKNEKMHSIAVHRYGITNSLVNMKIMLQMFKALWNNSTSAENCNIFANNFEINLNGCSSSIDIFEKIENHLPMMMTPSFLHNSVSSVSSFSQHLFFSILMEGKNDITMENYVDIGTVLSACTDVISGDVPESLNELAKSIWKTNDAQSFCEVDAKDGIQWLKDNSPVSHHKFNEFLKKHGHRSIKEFDLETDTWGLNPEKLIIALQSALKIFNHTEKKKIETDITNKLISPISYLTRKILKYVIPVCQKSVANREKTKSALILMVHKYRLAYRKLGKQMVKEWKIPDEKLIYFMTNTELYQYLKFGEPEYINKAILRRRYFSKWEKLKFSELCWGFPKPIETIVNIKSDGDCIVQGTPVHTGNIVGRACVIQDLSEISELENGDILITHSTDIGWSPYFPLLGGVVTELGGLISHGAVVAREYGLPCIVGASNATNMFKTGDTVLLDATKGKLEKINVS